MTKREMAEQYANEKCSHYYWGDSTLGAVGAINRDATVIRDKRMYSSSYLAGLDAAIDAVVEMFKDRYGSEDDEIMIADIKKLKEDE